MQIELLPLCTITITGGPWTDCGAGPLGTRLIAEAAAISVEGGRITGQAAGSPSGDWGLVGADGLTVVDARLTIRTHDGANILITYGGRVADVRQHPNTMVYVAPTFWTGDPRYRWLNEIQAIAKGTFTPDGKVLTYSVYEVR